MTLEQIDRRDQQVHIVDISKSGVGIESNMLIEPGIVRFRDRVWGQYSGLLLWSKLVGTRYRAGIRFIPLSGSAEQFVEDQGARSGYREPLKDLDNIASTMIASIKRDAG